MVYFGKVRNGKVEFERRKRLPEGVRVRIEPVETRGTMALLSSLAEDWGVSDTAREHDHYASDAPKRTGKKTRRKTVSRRRR